MSFQLNADTLEPDAPDAIWNPPESAIIVVLFLSRVRINFSVTSALLRSSISECPAEYKPML